MTNIYFLFISLLLPFCNCYSHFDPSDDELAMDSEDYSDSDTDIYDEDSDTDIYDEEENEVDDDKISPLLKENLITSIATGNLLTINRLKPQLSSLITINWEMNGEIFNPLAYAVSLGKIEIIKILLAFGASFETSVNEVPIILFASSIENRALKQTTLEFILNESFFWVEMAIYFFTTSVNNHDYQSAEDLLYVAKKNNVLDAKFQHNNQEYSFVSMAQGHSVILDFIQKIR